MRFQAYIWYYIRGLLAGYEFWGHCDNDLIFGKISDFITPQLLSRYDKILANGHFSLYRNADEANHFFQRSEEAGIVPSWRKVLTSALNYGSDEWPGVARLWQELNGDRMYYEILFDDISGVKKHFISCQKMRNGSD